MRNSNNWGWSVSAFLYEFFYSKLVHEIDGYSLGYLADRIHGAKVLDAGAGTGNMSFKAIDFGANEVFALDTNQHMISRILRTQSQKEEYRERLHVVKEDLRDGIITRLSSDNPFDVAFFRRCLYFSRSDSIAVLAETYQNLSEDGLIFIVHPEKDKSIYYDNGNGRFAPAHWLRRQSAHLGLFFNAIEYQPYTKKELEALCSEACSAADIKFLPTIRPAYNFMVIQKNNFS